MQRNAEERRSSAFICGCHKHIAHSGMSECAMRQGFDLSSAPSSSFETSLFNTAAVRHSMVLYRASSGALVFRASPSSSLPAQATSVIRPVVINSSAQRLSKNRSPSECQYKLAVSPEYRASATVTLHYLGLAPVCLIHANRKALYVQRNGRLAAVAAAPWSDIEKAP